MRAVLGHIISVIALFALSFCDSSNSTNGTIKFATSADYPPFAFLKNSEIQGFEIDLARLIAKELGKQAVFQDMQFNGIPAAVNNGQTDAGIAAIAYTDERAKIFDFSDEYASAGKGFALIEKSTNLGVAIRSTDDLIGKKVACQLGSIMENWIKNENTANRNILITSFDSVVQIIESIKSGRFDFAIVESRQAKELVNSNKSLAYSIIKSDDNGYRIILKKGSLLRTEINSAIAKLKLNGKILELQKKWFKDE